MHGQPGWPQRLRQRLEQRLQQSWALPRPDLRARQLQPLSWLYGLLAALHRTWALHGLRRPRHAPQPLLVVGNLVAGGAGKTPTVLALLPRLRALGFRPGVVSRGQGRAGSEVRLVTADSPAALVGDEPLLIHLRGGVPVAVGADRLAAAQALCAAQPELDLLIADDGLQHHRLAREAEIWVFDERGAGNGLLLPAGPLRQHLPQALPERALVLYTAGVASTALPGHLGRRRLSGVLPLAAWWQGQATDPTGWAALRGRPLLAAAGLARPQAFFDMLRGQGLRFECLPLADHHRLQPLPWPADTVDVVVTEKDAVKLRPDQMGQTRVWVATLDFQPDPGFDTALARLCAGLRRAPTSPISSPPP